MPFESSPVFDPRTWRNWTAWHWGANAWASTCPTPAMGAILSPGKRTVSSALNILGIGQQSFSATSPIYHHWCYPNRAQWSPLQLSRGAAAVIGQLLLVGRCALVRPPSRWCSALPRASTVERRTTRLTRSSTLYKSQINYKNRVSSTKSLQEVAYAYPARRHSNPAAAL